jgi:uncharacterized membrane protein
VERSRVSAHPLHPLITHFPMALWATSLLWDMLGVWRDDALWWSFSFWSISVGLIFSFFAMVTGLIDYVKLPQGGAEEAVATLAYGHGFDGKSTVCGEPVLPI